MNLEAEGAVLSIAAGTPARSRTVALVLSRGVLHFDVSDGLRLNGRELAGYDSLVDGVVRAVIDSGCLPAEQTLEVECIGDWHPYICRQKLLLNKAEATR